MNRRHFIAALIGSAAGLAIEEAIPFNRVWFFPQKIRLANTWTETDIGMAWLRALEKRLIVSGTISREYDELFKIGDILKVHSPLATRPKSFLIP